MKINFSFFRPKISIFQKLLIGISVMLFLNLIIAYVGIVSVNKLESTSEIILKESNKYNNLHSLKLNFTELLMPANDYLIHGNKVEILNFKKLDAITKQQLEECKAVENNHFNEHFLEEIENIFHEVEGLSNKIFELKTPVGNTQGAIMMEVMDSNVATIEKKIDILLSSSSTLMNRELNSNQVTNTRTPRIIIIVVLIIIIASVIVGFYYAKEITKPLENLAKTAKNITQGNSDLKVEVNQGTHDEIYNFVNLFNNMIKVLSETTVSKDYLNSILAKIMESVIITNIDGRILIVNKATIDLLEYKEEELIGESIEKILLSERKKESITLTEETVQNIYNKYYSKSKIAIPVSFSKTFIYDTNNKKTGILYLAFHQSENGKKKLKLTKETSDNKRNIKLTEKIPLTNRELEVIKLILEDNSSQQIAEKLFISIRTVETHRKHIMEKLHTKSIIGLVHYAIQNGLI